MVLSCSCFAAFWGGLLAFFWLVGGGGECRYIDWGRLRGEGGDLAFTYLAERMGGRTGDDSSVIRIDMVSGLDGEALLAI